MRCSMKLHFGSHLQLKISRVLLPYEEGHLRNGKSIRLHYLEGHHSLTFQDLDKRYDETILTDHAFGLINPPTVEALEDALMDLLEFRWRVDEVEGSVTPEIQKLIDIHNGWYFDTYPSEAIGEVS